MKEANVRRIHSHVYSLSKYPPLPPRIRLAANSWERVWWVTLFEPMSVPERLKPLVSQYSTDTISIRAQLRTQRRLCFSITAQNLDEQGEFEVAMMIMSEIDREVGAIERVEDRPAEMWPISEF